jgi:6-phosphogluconolactonase
MGGLDGLSPESKIIIQGNTDWAFRAADIFSKNARDCVTKQGRFVVALSGGSTPRPVHRLLSQEPYCSDIPWNGTNIFWVDERCVRETDPASNFGAAKADFLDHIPIPATQIHPMPAEDFPEDGAKQYEQELKDFFGSNERSLPTFDLIFLGIGQDGHTASLFPGQRALDEWEKWVAAVKGGNPDVSRLTMTFPVLNHARQIVFLVSGKEKALVIKALFEETDSPLPVRGVRPVSGQLIWLMDQEASSLLSRERLIGER